MSSAPNIDATQSAAPEPTFDVALFGEAMLLLAANEPGPLEHATGFHKRTAGAETNVAIGLARLGLRVGWASRLGTDSMGRSLLAAMQSEGIDCSHVVCDAGQRTGFQLGESPLSVKLKSRLAMFWPVGRVLLRVSRSCRSR